jgi:hypothetical protein
VIDIAPTVAETMGCLTELREPGSKMDKLHAILNTIETLRMSRFFRDGTAAVIRQVGSAVESDRVKQPWSLDERDMRRNFKIKMETYLKGGMISEAEAEELRARYSAIVPEDRESRSRE